MIAILRVAFATKIFFLTCLVLCSILLTLQLVFLAGTIFLFFSARTVSVQRLLITALYRRDTWREMRRSDALTYHSLVALIVQVVFLPLTVTAIIGVAKVGGDEADEYETLMFLEEMLDVVAVAGGVWPGSGGGVGRFSPLCPRHPDITQVNLHPSGACNNILTLSLLVHISPCVRTSLL